MTYFALRVGSWIFSLRYVFELPRRRTCMAPKCGSLLYNPKGGAYLGCVCVNWSTVWEIWLNYGVVGLQASVRDFYILRLFHFLLTSFIFPARPICLSRFLDHIISSSSSYRPPIGSIKWSLTPLFISPAPHILLRNGTLSTWTLPPPSTLQPPPLVSAPCATCLLPYLGYWMRCGYIYIRHFIYNRQIY